MLRWLFLALFIASVFVSVSAIDCHCDEEGVWGIESILECQKVSDFLIAVAYFSIPLELLYFISCANIPFKWVLVQFIVFIVLCGLTHLLNGWTFSAQPSFQLIVSLTVVKILTALVSCATAITLLTLFPLILKIKVREIFLRQNVLELDQEVDMMKRQKEASLHVRMLTREIRKSIDKHTILYTTLVELSKTLNLQNCAVWMPNEKGAEINLTHELNPGAAARKKCSLSINDRDVLEIKKIKGVRILRQDSVLAAASSGGTGEPGAVAAIRMPLLQVSNFKGGTPEIFSPRYAILVLVLPSTSDHSVWGNNEMEIVEVVADQVAVALSHATVLEESQSMREKLKERNHVLQRAKEDAMKASHARDSFQKVMNNGMRRPMHSILGLLSILQDDNINPEQRIIVDTMVKASTVLSTLMSDAMEITAKHNGKFLVEIRLFHLHSLIMEASSIVKCMSVYKGFGFLADIPNSLPNQVMGDEKRTFQVLLHMVGHLLNVSDGKGSVIFRVVQESGTEEGNNNKVWNTRKPSPADDWVTIKFEIEVSVEGSRPDSSVSTIHFGAGRHNCKDVKKGLSFNICKKLVQMMQGNIWMSSDSQGRAQSMTLILRFQKQSSYRRRVLEFKNPREKQLSSFTFEGIQVLLADDDDVNRMVTKKLLGKLGCEVFAVSTGFQCLSALAPSGASFQVIILDLHMPEMDGFEVATRVRNSFRGRGSRPVIIALTASSEEHMWEKCNQVGMNGLIQKPVLLQRLADELQRVLHSAREGP
nr:protein EIN4 [Ipomoea batatas]